MMFFTWNWQTWCRSSCIFKWPRYLIGTLNCEHPYFWNVPCLLDWWGHVWLDEFPKFSNSFSIKTTIVTIFVQNRSLTFYKMIFFVSYRRWRRLNSGHCWGRSPYITLINIYVSIFRDELCELISMIDNFEETNSWWEKIWVPYSLLWLLSLSKEQLVIHHVSFLVSLNRQLKSWV